MVSAFFTAERYIPSVYENVSLVHEAFVAEKARVEKIHRSDGIIWGMRFAKRAIEARKGAHKEMSTPKGRRSFLGGSKKLVMTSILGRHVINNGIVAVDDDRFSGRVKGGDILQKGGLIWGGKMQIWGSEGGGRGELRHASSAGEVTRAFSKHI